MKKQRNWLPLMGGSILCILFYAITMFSQDRIFSQYKNVFREIQHPIGTKRIAVYNSFGTLDKTRVMYKEDFPQGCDYRVGEVREYSGDKENIRAFYATQAIEFQGQELSPGVLFLPMDQAGVINPYGFSHDEDVEWGPGVFDLLENLKEDQHLLKIRRNAPYYYVGIAGFSLSDYDLRCQF